MKDKGSIILTQGMHEIIIPLEFIPERIYLYYEKHYHHCGEKEENVCSYGIWNPPKQSFTICADVRSPELRVNWKAYD